MALLYWTIIAGLVHRFQMYPVDALDETVEFLSELADLYKKTHSALLKHAYTNILHELLQPLAEVLRVSVSLSQL